MSTGENELEATETETAVEEPKRKLDMEVQISDVGPCKKHLKIAIARADVERQFNESIGSIRREAAVPGFRPGRAPRALVERRFRKEVAGQVKSALLVTCLEQLDEDYKLNLISQPDLDPDAIELPDDGPMTLEMDVEVQPDFPLPAYKALTVQRPVKQVTDADVEAQFASFLERYAQLVPKLEGGAEPGDYITADLTFHRDGRVLNEVKEVQFRLHPVLRFQDGSIPDLAGALTGVRPGETRETEARIGSASADPTLRNQTVGVTVHVHDLKTLRLPEVNKSFLESIGFGSEEELRQGLRAALERRLAYQQREALRRQILDQLQREVPFDLPADLVARQERSTLRRLVAEMRQAGLSDAQIRAREAELRADAHETTLRSLKDFFLLSKIAEAEGIKVEEEDINHEIEAIAARTDETPRRVRARIEKEGLVEGLATQILERKTIDRILEYVKVEEVPLEEEKPVETLDQMVAQEAEPAPAEPAGAEG
ncbi:MAG: trigger factor, partial [Isosphaeraceae bacterium]|nr:trigger factor [Isosphaeraceae bacterium]